MLRNENGDFYIGQQNHTQYQLLEMLGYGANGTVYLGKEISGGQLVAIKELQRGDKSDHERMVQDNEAIYHQTLSSLDNILEIYDVVIEEDALYLIMEYCQYGDLFEWVVRQTSEQRIQNVERNKTILLEILQAVMVCHSNGIYHRDLKPENCMLAYENGGIRLGDFGLATKDPISWDFGCGSACYMSPECNVMSADKGQGFDTVKNDIWSLGIIMINVMCGLNPWKQACIEDESFVAYLKDPTYLLDTLNISETFYEILKDTLNVDPSKRPSLKTISRRIQECNIFLKEQSIPLSSDITNKFNKAILNIQVENDLNEGEELYYSDSCYSLSSPVNAMFDIIPSEPSFDKDNLISMYFEDGIDNYNSNLLPNRSYIDMIELDC